MFPDTRMAILDHIYEAVTDDEAFRLLPAAIADTLGARSCSMLAYDPTRQITEFMANHFSAEMYRFQQDPEVAAIDVWTELGARSDRLGRVTNCADFWDTATFRRTPYFNECIRAFGDDSVQAMGGVIRGVDGFLAFAVHSGQATRPFVRAQERDLGGLMPHVFRMMDLRARLDGARLATDLLQRALDEMPGAVFGLDADQRIKAVNRRGQMMILAGDGLKSAGQRLHLCHPRLQDRFAVAVRCAASWSGGHSDAILVPRAQRASQLRVLVSPLAGAKGVALVLVEDPDDRDPTVAETLAKLFGLTTSEAQVAALLAEGESPEEAAVTRGVRLSTVRTQIKSLMAKTEARRLTDLVRVLARAPRRPPPQA